MTEQPDPERLLAEALRAQAVRAPLTDGGTHGAHGGRGGDPFGLLSGTEHQHNSLPARVDESVTAGLAFGSPSTARLPVVVQTQVSGWWILLLAVLLGLAAGAVVGLLSII